MAQGDVVKHTWVCKCRTETDCTAEDIRLGAVFECPGCKVVWGCVRPHRGGAAWVKIEPIAVKFHRLLEPVEED